MSDLGCLTTPTSPTVRVSPISATAFRSLQTIINDNSSMVWIIGPRRAAYTSVNLSSKYGLLDMTGVDNSVSLRYNTETYVLRSVKCHLPLGYGGQLFGGSIAELSCLFTLDSSTSGRKYIRWIFPIFLTSDDTTVTLGLKSWFTTNADAKPVVESFEDMLPDTIRYIQWSDCFTSSSPQNQTVSNILTTCYSIDPLYIRTLQTGKLFTYQDSNPYTGSEEQLSKRGIQAVNEPYVYTLDIQPFANSDIEGRFAIYTYRTGRVKQKTKQKKLAKCFAVNLDRDMDANGLINVDSTGNPLDPVTVQSLAGNGPQTTLNAIDLEGVEKQKEFTNNVLFWGSIVLFGFIGIVTAIWAIFYWLPARKVEASILESSVKLAELSKAAPMQLQAIPVKLASETVAAAAAVAAAVSAVPPGAL